MQPTISREAIVDRRHHALRWSPIIGGTVVAIGLWGVLQLFGVGTRLTGLVPSELPAHPIAIGTGGWSILAPLIAMFAGGYFVARLLGSLDRKVAGEHAAVVWGTSALIGMVAMRIVPATLGTIDLAGNISPDDPVLRSVDSVGAGLASIAITTMLGILTAIGGALLAVQRIRKGMERDVNRTAPYPVVTMESDRFSDRFG